MIDLYCKDTIRAILVEAGAPESELDWLVASCPDISYAWTYRPSLPDTNPSATPQPGPSGRTKGA